MCSSANDLFILWIRSYVIVFFFASQNTIKELFEEPSGLDAFVKERQERDQAVAAARSRAAAAADASNTAQADAAAPAENEETAAASTSQADTEAAAPSTSQADPEAAAASTSRARAVPSSTAAVAKVEEKTDEKSESFTTIIFVYCQQTRRSALIQTYR